MKEYYINVSKLRDKAPSLCCGDKIYLSGRVYTARDAAHKRIFEAIENNEKLPFQIENSVIYYAGPTPTPENLAVGSIGPTTSKRMDPYTPTLYDLGLAATIGKGERNNAVTEAIVKNGGLYLLAIGGAGALYAEKVKSLTVIAYEDLGCESVKELIFDNFPLIVGIDTKGNSILKADF